MNIKKIHKLALFGGKSVRSKPLPVWPYATALEKQLLKKVIDSNGWGVFRGQFVELFGQEFAKYHGAKYGIPCANATIALEVQLRALGIGSGDEVITTVYTFVATIEAILNVGAIPIFVDIREEDYCINPDFIESKITKRTKAIIPVHLYGSLCNLDKLVRIAKKFNLYLIEDAAQVPASFWRGRGVGTFGISGSFSFQESKVITAGEGGIIITNDRNLCELAHAYINCGRVRPGAKLPRKILGFNYRMTEFQAAVLFGQMKYLKQRTKERERNAQYLTNRLARIPGIGVVRKDPRVTTQAYYSYLFKYNEDQVGVPRELFIRALEAEGIPTRKLYVPIYRDPLFSLNKHDSPEAWHYYRYHRFAKADFPVAERAGLKEGVVIWHPLLSGDKSGVEDIARAVEKVISHIEEIHRLV